MVLVSHAANPTGSRKIPADMIGNLIAKTVPRHRAGPDDLCRAHDDPVADRRPITDRITNRAS